MIHYFHEVKDKAARGARVLQEAYHGNPAARQQVLDETLNGVMMAGFSLGVLGAFSIVVSPYLCEMSVTTADDRWNCKSADYLGDGPVEVGQFIVVTCFTVRSLIRQNRLDAQVGMPPAPIPPVRVERLPIYPKKMAYATLVVSALIGKLSSSATKSWVEGIKHECTMQKEHCDEFAMIGEVLQLQRIGKNVLAISTAAAIVASMKLGYEVIYDTPPQARRRPN